MPKIENKPDDVAMSDEEICTILSGISKMTLKRYREKHGLPGPSFRVGQSKFTWRSELDEWIAAQHAKGTDYRLPHHLKGKSPVPREEDQPRESAEPSGEDMNALTEIAEARKIANAQDIFRAALERSGGDLMSAARSAFAENKKNDEALLSVFFYGMQRFAAEERGDRDGVGVGHVSIANKADTAMPASTPANSGAEGRPSVASVGGPQRGAPAPLPERGEEGHYGDATSASASLPSSPLPLSKNTGGAGHASRAPERHGPIARPPVALVEPSAQRLAAKKESKEASAAAAESAFYIFGRSVWTYRLYELERIRTRCFKEARERTIEGKMADRILAHVGATQDRTLTVEDSISRATMAKIRAEVEKEVANVAA